MVAEFGLAQARNTEILLAVDELESVKRIGRKKLIDGLINPRILRVRLFHMDDGWKGLEG